MADSYLLLKTLHLIGDVVWIGSIAAVGVLLMTRGAVPETRGALARVVYLRLAVPGFALAFAAGVILLLLDPAYYFVKTHFMHAKLSFALVVIVLHHVLGAKAKRMANKSVAEPGAAPVLTFVLLGCAALAAVFGIFKF